MEPQASEEFKRNSATMIADMEYFTEKLKTEGIGIRRLSQIKKLAEDMFDLLRHETENQNKNKE